MRQNIRSVHGNFMFDLPFNEYNNMLQYVDTLGTGCVLFSLQQLQEVTINGHLTRVNKCCMTDVACLVTICVLLEATKLTLKGKNLPQHKLV